MDLADKTNRYIELKKIIPSTENGKKRTEFARNLLNFASTTLNGRELNPEKEHDLKEIDPAEIKEDEIDAINAQLEPLKYLIIPGGNILSSRAHVCRTVCRRAERNLVRMGREYDVDDVLRRFVNRLSDYFFVLSRLFMKRAGVAEKPWKPMK